MKLLTFDIKEENFEVLAKTIDKLPYNNHQIKELIQTKEKESINYFFYINILETVSVPNPNKLF
jgi:uncharacterized protein (DUF2461 family)